MSIAYTEKGHWLHDAIQAAGHSLHQHDGEWIASDEAAVQAIIDGFDPLPFARQEAKVAIDRAAGDARARYITVAPGQEATYQLKEQQARKYLADGTIGAMLQMEADATGQAVGQVAGVIVATADAWISLAAHIEAARMGGKAQVNAVTEWAQIAAIVQTVVAALEAA